MTDLKAATDQSSNRIAMLTWFLIIFTVGLVLVGLYVTA
jgi:hypothetical protein